MEDEDNGDIIVNSDKEFCWETENGVLQIEFVSDADPRSHVYKVESESLTLDESTAEELQYNSAGK